LAFKLFKNGFVALQLGRNAAFLAGDRGRSRFGQDIAIC
jgi:hypothetical protein